MNRISKICAGLVAVFVVSFVASTMAYNYSIVADMTMNDGGLRTKTSSTTMARAGTGTTDAKFDAYLKMRSAIQEVKIANLHWDTQIAQVQDVAANWKTYGFTEQEIISLFAEIGEALQQISCRGQDNKCFDGASTNHKATVWLQMELERAKLKAESGNQAPIYCETGFNYGKSSMAALLAGYQVYAFDVQLHGYSDSAAGTLGMIWPNGTFTMIKGNSLETIPKFAKEHPDIKCDVLSVDGLHSYEGVMKDVSNFQKMAAPRALVFIDDTGPTYNGGALYKAWKELIGKKVLTELKFIHYGTVVTARGPRDVAWGVAELAV